MQASLNQRW